jgi:hypothetical protein
MATMPELPPAPKVIPPDLSGAGLPDAPPVDATTAKREDDDQAKITQAEWDKVVAALDDSRTDSVPSMLTAPKVIPPDLSGAGLPDAPEVQNPNTQSTSGETTLKELADAMRSITDKIDALGEMIKEVKELVEDSEGSSFYG